MKLLVARDGRADQGRSDLRQHLVLRALHDRGKGEHVLLAGDRGVGRLAVDDHGPQVGTALHFDQTRAVGGRHVGDALFLQIRLDHLPNAPWPCPAR